MNFFAEQDRARRKTLVLVLLMAAAVLCLILMTALVAGMALQMLQQPIDSPNLGVAVHAGWGGLIQRLMESDLLYYTSASVLLVVIGGSFYKMLQLGGSGRKVAEMLGGRLIPPNTRDPEEKKVLNVVEEMAIASGNPVPQVYVLEESAINAFAAGSDRRNAVIGITRGAMELLNREELQGVIAHEFSHIHNGDMRLNLRLVAILHGILVIGLIGSFLLRSTARRSNDKNRGAQVGLGLALVILGYCGVFFGNLIKAAVSRQREFLADASAVQFTRNPDGIANALKKIGGHSRHALLDNERATEYSHLYFAQGVSHFLGRLMATHPDLSERIRKIQPRWNGAMITPSAKKEEPAAEPAPAPPASGVSAEQALGLVAAVASIGNPQAESLAAAQDFLHELPQALHDAAHDPFSARALLFGLLLDKNTEYRERQRAHLRQHCDSETWSALEQLQPAIDALARSQYLPLVELAIPALKNLSPAQYEGFNRNLVALIKADEQISLLEWCLYRTVSANCENRVARGHLSLKQVSDAVATVLLMVCDDASTRTAAFEAAAAHLPQRIPTPDTPLPAIAQLDAALKQLEQLRPLEKPQFLKALAAAIQADGKVTHEEAELFRALADCLDCPVPLLRVS
jgi:Zn-dependent protease with chaperone function/uncharacterized tellurite resistance protein B-like protein